MPLVVVTSYTVGFIYFTGKLGFAALITVQFYDVRNDNTLRPEGRIRLFHFTLPHCHHYADVSEGIEPPNYLSSTFCRLCV